MASLFDRAGIRCEQNILRRWPAWRQAHMTEAERPLFRAWKAANVAHLEALRARIIRGEDVQIDKGWPDPRGEEVAIEIAAPAPAAAAPETPAPSVTLTASYTFDPAFLERERRTSDESLAAVDLRLLAEYEGLEVARPLDGRNEERRRQLFENFYEFKG